MGISKIYQKINIQQSIYPYNISTWNYVTMYRLLALNRNTYYDITMCKQIIIIDEKNVHLKIIAFKHWKYKIYDYNQNIHEWIKFHS